MLCLLLCLHLGFSSLITGVYMSLDTFFFHFFCATPKKLKVKVSFSFTFNLETGKMVSWPYRQFIILNQANNLENASVNSVSHPDVATIHSLFHSPITV